MDIVIEINGIPTKITLTEGQVAQIEAQSKPKKFEQAYDHEKIYEWQWVYHKKFMEQTARTKYMTDAEFIKLCEENDMSGFEKQEKTKRLRVC